MNDAARRVFRHEVPVDDQWHEFELTGPILHVATRHYDRVEFWTIADLGGPVRVRTFRVFGTGQPLPDDAAIYIGSAFTPSRNLVWHVFERDVTGTAPYSSGRAE